MLVHTQSGQICIFDIGDARRRIWCLENEQFTPVMPRLPTDVLNERPHSQHTALEDRSGRWWISSSLGLMGFRDLRRPPAIRLLPRSGTGRFFEDSRGDLWIAVRFWERRSAPHGVARWDRAQNQLIDETSRLPDHARSSVISAFAEDRAGQIWIGLGRPSALLRLKGGRFQHVPAGLNGPIQQLLSDSSGRLWIAASEQGLARIDDPDADEPRIRLYTRSEGLSSNEVWCMVEDRLRRICIGTARGVDRINVETGEIEQYSQADGLVPRRHSERSRRSRRYSVVSLIQWSVSDAP